MLHFTLVDTSGQVFWNKQCAILEILCIKLIIITHLKGIFISDNQFAELKTFANNKCQNKIHI